MTVRVPVPVQDRNDQDEAFTRRLRQAVDAGGGPSHIARLSETPLRSLNEYLAGRDPKRGRLVAIARACKVSVEWLATGENPPERPAAAPPSPPQLFQIVDMSLLEAAIHGARLAFEARGSEPEGENFARVVCLLYDEGKAAKDKARNDDLTRK